MFETGCSFTLRLFSLPPLSFPPKLSTWINHIKRDAEESKWNIQVGVGGTPPWFNCEFLKENHCLLLLAAATEIPEVHLKASEWRMHVSATIGTHLCPSAPKPRPLRVVYSQETVQWSRSRLHVEAQCSVSSILKLNTTHTHTHTLVVVVFICTFFFLWRRRVQPRVRSQHDFQEAEESELQRTRVWTRISGQQRHLFPFV